MKFKLYMVCLAASVLSFPALSQCTETINLTTQAQVDAFPTTYGCSSLSSDLNIGGSGITNLDSLYMITATGGNLVIDGTGVTDLDGLQQLTAVYGMLVISNNPNLIDIDALSHLTIIKTWYVSTSSVQITGNASLTNLHGLSGIRSLPGNLSIYNNPALLNLDGLDSLRSVVSVSVVNNDAMTNIDALRNIKSSRGASFSDNAVLQNLNGLIGLTNISSNGPSAYLTISNNASLNDITGLSNLASFSGVQNYFTLSDNPQLMNGCPIFSLLRDGLSCQYCGGHITITGNGPNVTYDGILTTCVNDENRRCDIDFTFTTQAQVDAFKANYGCAVIDGIVVLNGTGITNVDSLITIQSVKHLNIENTGLANLSGLSNLTEINGGIFCEGCTEGLAFQSNQLLTDISALSSLRRLEGTLGIGDSPLLENLHGLEGLDSIGGNLALYKLPNLHSLEALSGLTELGTNHPEMTRLNIGNTGLTDLHGLEGITTIAGILDISDNSSLRNLDGLNNLTFIGHMTSVGGGVGGTLGITKNPMLQDIEGLSALETIVSEVQIWQNASLKNVDGLRSLKKVGWETADVADFYITDNDSLENLDGLANFEQMVATSLDVWPRLNVSENDRLVRFCGLYKLISGNGMVSCESANCSKITIRNNGVAITGAEIVSGGPCESGPTEDPDQPTNIAFSDVTDTSMTVTFSGNANADGYIAVMRSFESSYPDDVPVDGTEYHGGEVIGYSSIVVSVSADTVLNIVYLTPDVDYWFDIYSYTNNGTYDYVTTSPLEGMQRTLPEGGAQAAYPNPFVDNVTISFTTSTTDNVSVVIFDSMGGKVADVANSGFSSGSHEVVWNGVDARGNVVPRGTYYYHVKNSEGVRSGRLVK